MLAELAQQWKSDYGKQRQRWLSVVVMQRRGVLLFLRQTFRCFRRVNIFLSCRAGVDYRCGGCIGRGLWLRFLKLPARIPDPATHDIRVVDFRSVNKKILRDSCVACSRKLRCDRSDGQKKRRWGAHLRLALSTETLKADNLHQNPSSCWRSTLGLQCPQ